MASKAELLAELDVDKFDVPNFNRLVEFFKNLINSIYGVTDSLAPKYKVYHALISQTGVDAPTVKVLENTIGALVWTYDGVGIYQATLAGAFTLNKTSFLFTPNKKGFFQWFANDVNVIEVNVSDSAAAASDGLLGDATIEIRVYN